jgi:hypothetical protein
MRTIKNQIMKKRLEILFKKNDVSSSDKIRKFNKSDINYILKNKELTIDLMVSLMETENNSGLSSSMWKGKSCYLFIGFIELFFKITNENNIDITPDLLIKNLGLDSLVQLQKEFHCESPPPKITDYIFNLPHYNPNKTIENQSISTHENHEYTQMQLIYILGELKTHFNYPEEKKLKITGFRVMKKLESF